MTPGEYSAAYTDAMKRLREFEHEFKEKIQELDLGLSSARAISREATQRMVLLSASIVGFSATVQSIEGLKLNTDTHLLKVSWALFLVAIVLGPMMSIIEARASYTITWRSFQVQEQDWRTSLGFWRKAQALLVLFYSVAWSPRNLILCRIYKNENEKKLKARQNGMTVALANLFINLVLFLEIIFVAVFIAALIILVLSVGL
jgi:hypothetical protein